MRRNWALRFSLLLLLLLVCRFGPAWSSENFLETINSVEKQTGVAADKPAKAVAHDGRDPFRIFDDASTLYKTASETNSVDSWKKKILSKFGIKATDSPSAKWTAAQLEKLYGILNKLPASYRQHTKTIVREKMYKSKYVLGYVKRGIPTVHLLNAGCSASQFTDTIVHEMMHVFLAKNQEKLYSWGSKFWPKGATKPTPPSVNAYGNTNPEEDLCESVAFYFSKAKAMKSAQPARYEFIKKNVFFGKEF